MLKWTSSAQKLSQQSPTVTPLVLMSSPMQYRHNKMLKRNQSHATIANKENMPSFTSTPMVSTRLRYSPLVLAPLAHILNITPETSKAVTTTSEQRKSMMASNVTLAVKATATATAKNIQRNRRHSMVSVIPANTKTTTYASTLPRFEEEYSPSTECPSGQQLALRGLLPDAFLGNPRYITTTEMAMNSKTVKKPLPKKRKLEKEFAEIAKETIANGSICYDSKGCEMRQKNLEQNVTTTTTTNVNSPKMDDETLDKLIDAILDSARKDEKKKKSRKSFNLRRRTLSKNQNGNMNDMILSPSYAPGDDPASDLSFLLNDFCASKSIDVDRTNCANNEMTATIMRVTATMTTPTSISLQATSAPVTPPGTPISDAAFRQMPASVTFYTTNEKQEQTAKQHLLDDSTHTFNLETPIHHTFAQKRQRRQRRLSETDAKAHKKFKIDECKFFEVGLALPSIYV